MKVMRILMVIGAVTSLAAASEAAESYDNCTGYIDSLPTTISTQGTWCLRQNVATSMSTGNAIEINANNVTLDCNDFKIGGVAAGITTQAIGIYSENRKNITVRHCSVRGFKYGVFLNYNSGAISGGHVVEDNRLDKCTCVGVLVWGNGSIVRRNLILDTGGGPSCDPVSIVTVSEVHILDNTVSGVTASGSSLATSGIYAGSANGTVSGNRISGLEPPSSGSVYAISVDSPIRLLVTKNLVIGPGSGAGIICSGGGTVRVKNNMFNGFSTGINGCGDAGGNDTTP